MCMVKETLKESKVGGGRIGVYCPDHPAANNKGYVLRYRYIMEKKLGRFLKSNECVHHKDGDVLNDSIENLVLLDRGEHTALHAKQGDLRGRKLDYIAIAKLISQGYGYKRIAKILGYNQNSTGSACRIIRLGHK